MNFLFNYILPFLNQGLFIFSLIVVFLAAGKRFSWLGFAARFSYTALIWLVLAVKSLYALLLTIGQYYLWSNSEFTRLFLNQKVVNLEVIKQFSGKLFWLFNNRFGYFLFYSWGRFWTVLVVSAAVSLLFYYFLKVLKKHRERYFEADEVELGFLLSLVVGWPNFVIFIPLAFVMVVLISIVRGIVFKEIYTTLGAPFLISALLVLVFGNYLINVLNLSVLKI